MGHRTNAKLAPIFGDNWWAFSDEDREQIILQVLHLASPDALAEWATNRWSLTPEQAERLKKVSLEDGYGSLSRRAIEKLLPVLRTGMSYAEARLKIYPESFKPKEPMEKLPPVNDWNSDIRNPAVIRTLLAEADRVSSLLGNWRYAK